MLIFDAENLLSVARVVAKFNPHASSDPAEIVAHMRGTAHSTPEMSQRPFYVATLGYMLTSYVPRWATPGDVHVKASIADHLAENIVGAQL